MADEAQPTTRLWRRRWLLHLALVAVAVVLLAFALRQVDWSRAKEFLGRLTLRTLLLAGLAYAAAWALRIWRLHILARAAAIRLKAGDAVQTGLGANAINIVAPARLGDAAAFLHLRRLSSDGPAAAAVLVTWRLGDLGALLVLALVAGPFVLVAAPSGNATTTLLAAMAGGAAFLVLAIAGGYLARHHKVRAMLDRVATRLLGSRAPLGAAFGRATSTLWRPRLFAGTLLLAILAWAFDIVLAGVLLQALWGGPNAYIVVAVPVLLANAAKALPTTPGAIGVYEVVFGVALNQYVGDPSAAAVFGFTGFAVHLLVNALTLLLGIPGAIAIGRSMTTAVAAPQLPEDGKTS